MRRRRRRKRRRSQRVDTVARNVRHSHQRSLTFTATTITINKAEIYYYKCPALFLE